MADPVTSKSNGLTIGKGKDKKKIFTATKVTPTKDKDGNTTYKMEIVQYDNAKGEGGRVIGTRNGDNITWNDNASQDIKGDGDAINKINKQSKNQAKKVRDEVTTSAAEDRAFNKSNAKGNEGTESENDQGEPTVSNLGDAQNAINAKAGKGAEGTRNEGFGTYVFPASLRTNESGSSDGQDYMKIDMMKYQPKDFSKKSFSFSERSHNEKDTDKRSIGHVILPIPGGIADGNTVNWGETSMSPLDMAKANIALTGVRDGFSEAISETGNMANNIASSFGDNKDALAAVIAGMAAGAGNLLTRTTGAISNPNMELLFGGPSLRTFSFQFQLAPRNQDEAMTAIQIIRFFKQGMAPIRTKSRLFMKSPHTFRLSYRNNKGKQHKYLNKFKECALGTFGVNYAPIGNYSTFEDGVMTAYQMSMSFRELNPIYNDDYGDGDFPSEIGF